MNQQGVSVDLGRLVEPTKGAIILTNSLNHLDFRETYLPSMVRRRIYCLETRCFWRLNARNLFSRQVTSAIVEAAWFTIISFNHQEGETVS